MVLNKYIAHSGICSRRKAAELIQEGAVKVNGVTVQDPAHRVEAKDKVTVKNRSVIIEKKVYILLNKPKDFITTVEDDRDRKTVMHLVDNASDARIYPIADSIERRLDYC